MLEASAELKGALRQAREVETRRALAASAKIRLVGALVFLLLAALLGLGLGHRDWSVYVPPLAVYAAVAAGVWAVRGSRAARSAGAAVAFVDVALVYLIQHEAIPISSVPAGVAGFSLGLFALLVTLSGSTSTAEAVAAVALASCVAQTLLMRQAGLPAGGIAAAWVVLPLVAAVSVSGARRLSHVAVDLSRAEIERQVERKQHEKLTALQRDKDSLIQLVVHDLRSPLTAMLGNIAYANDILKKREADRSVCDLIEDALGAGDRLDKLITEMLDVARLEEGRLTLKPSPALPGDLFERVRRQSAALARDKSVALEVAVTTTASLFLDGRLMTRVLENLVSNAIRHSPVGARVMMEASTVGTQHLIAVHNNGPAIDAALRRSLFEKYRQGPDASARSTGWGLGLYFCSVAVSAHGGQISVEDVPGWKTSFVVRLPVAIPATP